jgi:peptidoglycan hydrolase-like protein with peptidoglycan-binding domain
MSKLVTTGCAFALALAWATAPATAQTTTPKTTEQKADQVEKKAEQKADQVEKKAKQDAKEIRKEGDKTADQMRGKDTSDTAGGKLDRAMDKTKAKAREVKDKVTGNDRAAAGGAMNGDVRSAQMALKDKGHDPGPIDGVMGPRTSAAIKEFQQKENLNPTGQLDAETKSKLMAASGSASPSSSSSSASTPSTGSTGSGASTPTTPSTGAPSASPSTTDKAGNQQGQKK